MADGETGDNYLVVRNGTEQYSVWRTTEEARRELWLSMELSCLCPP
jgi:hypothetical protein